MPATVKALVEIVSGVHARFGERPSAAVGMAATIAADAPQAAAKRRGPRLPHPDQGALFGGSVAIH